MKDLKKKSVENFFKVKRKLVIFIFKSKKYSNNVKFLTFIKNNKYNYVFKIKKENKSKIIKSILNDIITKICKDW